MLSNGFLIKALLVLDMLKTKKYIYSYFLMILSAAWCK